MAYKEKDTKKWTAQWFETNAKGEKKKRRKRGFSTKKEALEYERQKKLNSSRSMDMKLSEFMEVYLWNFSIVQLILCRPSLWASAARFAYGAASIFWRDTGRPTLQAMLMCGKVTNDNLIDSSHYFRNTDQYEKLMWGFSYISFCLSKHFWESDVFVSFLLTASL